MNEFLNELKNNRELERELNSAKAQAIINTAKKHGYDISVDDLTSSAKKYAGVAVQSQYHTWP